MREELLHYIWQFKKFDLSGALTTSGESIEVLSSGTHNMHAGPDFFNAKIRIGDQLWAGNVEIHIRASDWYAHHHETDANYDSVILHVVWEDNIPVFREDGSKIPTFILNGEETLAINAKYQKLLRVNANWINCEPDFHSFSDFKIKNWLERLYFEKLEHKAETISNLLSQTKQDWERVLFVMLARSFGLNLNGDAFMSLAMSFDYKLMGRIKEQTKLEALLLGQSRLIPEQPEDAYSRELAKTYNYLKHKFKLNNNNVLRPGYFRLRPNNFPDIRLAQLAAVYSGRQSFYSAIIKCKSKSEFYPLFDIQVSDYWKKHYTFGKKHSPRAKKLTKKFVDLILINCVIPFRYSHALYLGKDENSILQDIIVEIEAEENSVVKKFNKLRKGTAVNALDSQALLKLKKDFCDKNRCLSCQLGLEILQRG